MSFPHKISDWIGISSAMLCTIHCLVAPLYFGGVVHAHHSEAGHWMLGHHWDYVFLLIGLGAVWFSSKHAESLLLKAGLWSTYGILAGAIMLEEFGAIVQGVIYLASAALIVIHILNLRQSLKPVLVRHSH